MAASALSGQPQVVHSMGSVTLYTQFQRAPPPVVLASIKDELQNIMWLTGNQFAWRSLAGARGDEVVSQLAVVRFVGRCDTAGIAAHPVIPGALGRTHISNGEVLPFSEVNCDGIRDFVQSGLLSIRPRDREDAYGRAIARVLAHELYHVLAKTVQHGAYGVGKAAFNTRDLLGTTFVLEESELERVRATNSLPMVETDEGTQ
jgi:hypothetical protein